MTGNRRVLFVIYSNPAGYPPVERAAAILRDNGFMVRILGASGLPSDKFEARRLRGIEVRLVSRAGSGLVQKLQYCWFLLWAAAHLIVWRPRWVHASDPFSTPLALLGAMLGAQVIYHEHDAPSASSGSAFLRLLFAARLRAATLATVVVTPNAERSKALSLETGREVLTIWNCPSRAELRDAPPAGNNAQLRLVYQGSIVPARLPLAILDAISRSHGDIVLQIMGIETMGGEGYVARFLQRAEELRISDRVVAIPPMPREQMLDMTVTGSVGLALMPLDAMDVNERTMAGASNKAFEYLACGLPIFVSALPDWRALFVEGGVAWECDPGDADSMRALIERALANRDELVRMGTLGRTLVEREWNYETRFRPVLDRLLADASTPAVPS